MRATVSASTLAGMLFRLYPRRFREQFREEWFEVVEWHRRNLSKVRFARVRLAFTLLADTVRALPSAWIRRRRVGPGGHRPGRPVRSRAPDLRHAVRALLRNPVFTMAAVLSVAMGIGVNTATFSVVNAVLLRPLPYDRPDRLAVVWNELPGAGMSRLPLSGPEVQMLREEPGLFEDVAGVWSTSGTVQDREGGASQVAVGRITPNFFSLLGVSPARGRSYIAEDGPAPAGVIVSDELWRTRFGADPAVVGGTIDLNGQAVPVIGVLPPDFTLFFPEDGAIPPRFDVYTALPWDLSPLIPDQHFLRVIGRLRDDVDPARAAAGVAAAAERAKRTWPQLQSTGDRFTVHALQEDTVRTARPVLLALLGAVGLFLLLVSTNVASLIVARTATRGRELAIRSSLGASRAALTRLVVLESLIVTGIGASAGIWLGKLGADALWIVRPAGLSRAGAVPLDGRVLGFSVALALVSAMAFALISLLSVRAVGASLRTRGGGNLQGRFGRRMREGLTAAQVAAGLILVTGSALMIRSVASLGAESIGFEPGNALTFRVPLSLARFPDDADRYQAASEIERRLSDLPGVLAVGATSHLPFVDWANWAEAAPPEGTPEAERSTYFADLRAVTPAYLETIGAQLVAGRFFDDRDDANGAPAVIIDQAMADRAFPGQDPVGRVLEPSRFTAGDFVVTPATVAGVIQNIRDRSPAVPSAGQVFWPFAQSPRWELTFHVRTTGDPLAIADDVRREVAAINPDLTVARLAPMSDYVQVATALTRFLARIASLFSALALAAAAIGLYGVVAFVTIQRTREIAVRVAVGATRPEILRGIIAHGIRIGAIGVAIGALGALMLSGFMQGLVYGVSARDPLTLVAVSALLVGVSALASMAPARRATRLDPVTALRES